MARPAYKFEYRSRRSTTVETHVAPGHVLPFQFPATGRRSLGRYVEPIGLVALDALAIGVALLLALTTAALVAGTDTLRSLALVTTSSRVVPFVVVSIIALTWFHKLGHYTRRKPFWDQLADVLRTFALLALIEVACLSLLYVDYSRAELLLTWGYAIALVPAFRGFVVSLLRNSGRWARRTLILGCGPNAVDAAAALRDEPALGADVVGFIAMPGETVPEAGYIQLADRCVPVTPIGGDPAKLVRSLNCWNVVVALEHERLDLHRGLIKQLHKGVKNVTIVPALRGLPLYGMEIEHFIRHEVLMLNVRNNLARPSARMLKRSFDIIGSAAALVLLSPLFAYIAWQTRKSGGSVFYGHTRIGKDGHTFKCFKFRSMVPNADQVLADLLARDLAAREEWERDFKLKNDPRITPIGRFLRRTSLDELPQLWNVLKGDMSLVGPRPIVREEVHRYDDDIDYYLEVSPGITGLWQVSGRNDVDYKSRVQLDAWYVRNWSLWYDVVILFQTVRTVLGRTGAY